MGDEKHRYDPADIPTYEEAIGESSRSPIPSPSRIDEAGNAEEREGLLGFNVGGRMPIPTRRQGYRPPPTEENASTRSSIEQAGLLDGQDERRHSTHSEEEEVRREMEELEIEEPAGPRSVWGKRISSLSQSLSRFNLPFTLKFPKFKWPVIDASFCIVLSRVFAILLVIGVMYILFVSNIFSTAARMNGQMFDPESVRIHVQNMADAGRIAWRLQQITQSDHLAGTEGDFVSAEYVAGVFESSGLDEVRVDEYAVYLNYPKEGGRKVEILGQDGGVTWSAAIEEPVLYNADPPRQQTPVFHGHSKSGNATGPLIYANYGSREDFKRLQDKGIDTKGAIALVKYYGTEGDRALKVKAAELAGFAGCIIYSDPADDGFVLGEVAPNGRYMPETGVQRGAVSLMSWVVGDVLTPGWASKKGAKRLSPEESPGLVNIPSIPLSWGDAQNLLKAIQGVGERVPDEWKGGVPNVEYWTGDASSPKVRLVNDQDEVTEQPIWNVIGKITGIEQGEKTVIVGNHRDAWVFGATDPGSGTAILLEIVHIFGDLVARGWRPLRTIEFASWDGEEYNLIGSTEYVEDRLDTLRANAYAYLNVDVAVSGSEFRARGSPVFKKSLMRVLDRVTDEKKNATLRALWDERHGHLEGLGAGSDYVAFQDIAGTSSLDFGFVGDPYPYHSAYDNFEWMARVGDPDFLYHKLIAQVWALLILEFADRLILPFDMSAYSGALTNWAIDLDVWMKKKTDEQNVQPVDITPLKEAVLQFHQDAEKFEEWEVQWDSIVLAAGGFESGPTSSHRQSHNTRMANFETHLLDLEEGGGVSFPKFTIRIIM